MTDDESVSFVVQVILKPGHTAEEAGQELRALLASRAEEEATAIASVVVIELID